jgi:Fe-S-cluster-containing dehydrogenase component
VQRINYAKITAEKDDRKVRDGEIVPACAAVCPSQAIMFGDLNDPKSRVSEWKRSSLNYSLLGELNTRPRTTYLTEIRNPNPEVQKSEKDS